MASICLPSTPGNCSGDDGNEAEEVSAITVNDSFQRNGSYTDTTGSGRGSWKHAAFHVATTIATPAAYAPLPFAVSSLGWPLGSEFDL